MTFIGIKVAWKLLAFRAYGIGATGKENGVLIFEYGIRAGKTLPENESAYENTASNQIEELDITDT